MLVVIAVTVLITVVITSLMVEFYPRFAEWIIGMVIVVGVPALTLYFTWPYALAIAAEIWVQLEPFHGFAIAAVFVFPVYIAGCFVWYGSIALFQRIFHPKSSPTDN